MKRLYEEVYFILPETIVTANILFYCILHIYTYVNLCMFAGVHTVSYIIVISGMIEASSNSSATVSNRKNPGVVIVDDEQSQDDVHKSTCC